MILKKECALLIIGRQFGQKYIFICQCKNDHPVDKSFTTWAMQIRDLGLHGPVETGDFDFMVNGFP